MNFDTDSVPLKLKIYSQMIGTFGSKTALVFSVIENKSSKHKNGKAQLNQKYIQNGCGVHHGNQSRHIQILKDWKLLDVVRGEKRTANIFTVFEANLQLFLYAPEAYKNAVKNSEMKSFLIKTKIDQYKSLEFINEITDGALFDNVFDIERIGKNIRNYDENTNKLCVKSRGLNKYSIEDKSSTPSSIDEDSTFAKTANVKGSLRSRLQGINSQQRIKPTQKRISIDKFYNGKDFRIVMRYWNSLSGKKALKKISDLTEKQNLTLDTSVLAVQALLSGRLFKSDIILPNRKTKELHLPNDFDLASQNITRNWLLEKITLFHKIVTDPMFEPLDKTHVRKLTLGDFILGTQFNEYIFPSTLFATCCSEIKTVWEDTNPQLTKKICNEYNLYTEQDKEFTGKELKTLATLSERIISFSNTREAKQSRNMGKGNPLSVVGRFFVTQQQEWRGKILEQTPNYFAGEHAWGVFEKRLEY